MQRRLVTPFSTRLPPHFWYLLLTRMRTHYNHLLTGFRKFQKVIVEKSEFQPSIAKKTFGWLNLKPLTKEEESRFSVTFATYINFYFLSQWVTSSGYFKNTLKSHFSTKVVSLTFVCGRYWQMLMKSISIKTGIWGLHQMSTQPLQRITTFT
jgi:hypothetical protein